MFSDAEIGVFLDELDEKIQVMNDGFLALERDGENPGIIQEIFRAAHTIKGSSAIMGYEQMSLLTHEMENLFDRIRQGEVTITPEMIDLLFEALDTLKAMRDQVMGGEVTVEAGVLDRLKTELNRAAAGVRPPERGTASKSPEEGGRGKPAALESPAGEDPAEEEPLPRVEPSAVELEVIREAAAMGRSAYRIGVGIDRDCQMKSVRAFLVFQRLEEFGEVIQSAPAAESIQEGHYGRGFEVLLISGEDGDYIKNMLMTIAEVDSVTVEPVDAASDNGDGEAAEPVPTESAPAAEPSSAETAGQPKTAFEKPQTVPEKTLPPSANEYKAVKTVRIDVRKLDNLMNLVGELVIERTRLDRFAHIVGDRLGSDEMIDTLNEISNHLGQVTADLQDEIMKARMLPIAQVFNRFPRMVRDLAHKLEKQIDLVIEGRDTELDRNVIEVISDPLIHLIRNAIDHGIEPTRERLAAGKPAQGTLRLRAYHHENHIVIVVEDDGRGLDPEQIRAKALEKKLVKPEAAARMTDQELFNLVFLPGFSTAKNVSDLSGRGVGMDVVKSQIEAVNGSVEINSVPGQGTSCVIKLPLTLAIIKALMVRLGDQVYALPLSNVLETVQISRSEIQLIKNSEVVVVRGVVLPLIRLGRLFNQAERDAEKLYVVIVGTGDHQVGVIVDRLIGEQEIVIKSLGEHLGRIAGLSGATILGDGRVSLIIDVRALISEVSGRKGGRTAYAG